MITDFDYIDHLILYTINTAGIIDDFSLSQQLGCPRMLLLDRLSQLVSEEYIANHKDNQYSLSKKGIREMVPLTHSKSKDVKDISAEVLFNWDYLYIPEAGWDST